MSNFTVQRALLSAKWEIEPRYGLQSLARFLAEAEARPTTGIVEAINQIADGVLHRLGMGGKPRNALTLIQPSDSAVITVGGPPPAQEEAGQVKNIAHVRMSGPMMLDGGMCSYGVRDVIAELRTADADPNVGAVLFEVDSGGGESSSGTELHNTLRDMTKPVVVYTQMLASAALRGTLAADAIYAAHDDTDVGSIGSYIAVDREQLEDIKESVLFLYADQSTEKNAEFRALLEGDEAPLRKYVTTGAQSFIDEVERWRPAMNRTADERKRMQGGALFTATDAARMGLISGVATFGQVVDLLSGILRAEARQSGSNPAGTQQSRPASLRDEAARIGIGQRAFATTEPSQPHEDVKHPITPAAAEATQPQPSPVENTNPTTPEPQQDSPTAALTARVETLIQTVEAQATTIASLSEKLDQAATERAQQNQVIASLKAGNSAAETPNGRRADREQFATAARVDEKNQELASAGSKY